MQSNNAMSTKNQGNRRKNIMDTLRGSITAGAIIAFIIVMLVMIVFGKGRFFTRSNLMNVLRQGVVLSIVAVGQTFVIINGGIDLSVASLVSTGSVIVAKFIVTYQMNWILGFAVAVLVCAALGALNGLLITTINMPPIIATLATAMAFEGMNLLYTKGYGINLPTGHPLSAIFGRGNFIGIPISAFLMVLIYLLFYFILRYTTLGRVTYGLGGNEHAVYLSGVSVKKYRILVYMISGLMAGFAGVILAGRVNTGHPHNGSSMDMESISAAVLGGASVAGGIGSLWGTLIGVFTLTIIDNGLNMMKINPYLQMMVKGLIIVAAISFSSLREKKR